MENIEDLKKLGGMVVKDYGVIPNYKEPGRKEYYKKQQEQKKLLNSSE